MSNIHLERDELIRLKSGGGTQEEKLRWLEHISQCDDCAELLAQVCEEGPMLRVSPLFAESVLREIAATEERSTSLGRPMISGRRPVAVDSRKLSGGTASQELAIRQRNLPAKQEKTPRVFRYYPFKVGVAACMAILLLNAGIFGVQVRQMERLDDRREPQGGGSRQELLLSTARPFEEITKSLRSVSQALTEREGYSRYDKEEK